ncbi:MAG: phosphatase PAP2 family protein [bacterium]
MFNFLFSLSKYPLIAKSALFISYPFAYVAPVIIVVFLLVRKQQKMATFSLLFLTGFFSWISARVIKNMFHTVRPYIEQNVVPLFYEPGYSFPSEHVTIFTALSVAVFFLHRKCGIVLGVITILIAISRIIIGVHYPIDILGGFVLGGIIGFLLVKVFKNI